MTLRLEPGHRAVVVGAGGAIGGAICRAYAAAGATVLCLDVDGAAARGVAGELEGDGHAAAPLDATQLEAVRAAAAESERGGGVRSVCYAAGVAPTFDVLEFDWAAYHRTMAVNLDGALHVAHAFGRVLAGGGGAMTFLASTAGRHGAAGAAAYCASKFALRGVVESFALEVGRHGIRVNAVCPGDVATPMLATVAAAQGAREGRSAQAELERYRAATALGRLVRPEEVADAVVWLASPAASAVTGASIDVSAGPVGS